MKIVHLYIEVENEEGDKITHDSYRKAGLKNMMKDDKYSVRQWIESLFEPNNHLY